VGGTMLLELLKCINIYIYMYMYKILWSSVDSNVLLWRSWISSVPPAIFSDNVLN
jgi:hypothetical protein